MLPPASNIRIDPTCGIDLREFWTAQSCKLFARLGKPRDAGDVFGLPGARRNAQQQIRDTAIRQCCPQRGMGRRVAPEADDEPAVRRDTNRDTIKCQAKRIRRDFAQEYRTLRRRPSQRNTVHSS